MLASLSPFSWFRYKFSTNWLTNYEVSTWNIQVKQRQEAFTNPGLFVAIINIDKAKKIRNSFVTTKMARFSIQVNKKITMKYNRSRKCRFLPLKPHVVIIKPQQLKLWNNQFIWKFICSPKKYRHDIYKLGVVEKGNKINICQKKWITVRIVKRRIHVANVNNLASINPRPKKVTSTPKKSNKQPLTHGHGDNHLCPWKTQKLFISDPNSGKPITVHQGIEEPKEVTRA